MEPRPYRQDNGLTA